MAVAVREIASDQLDRQASHGRVVTQAGLTVKIQHQVTADQIIRPHTLDALRYTLRIRGTEPRRREASLVSES